ncbi:MAG: winged helix-turn-helix domain-containing protein [Myxococcota bacterium]
MRVGPWWVHTDRQLAIAGGVEVHLTPTEARLLSWLGARPGVPVPDRVLLTEVWGYAPTVQSDAPYFTWRRLVGKLEPDPKRPRWLRRVSRGVLYDPGSSGRPLFVGRTAELEALDQARQDHRRITVCGEAGVGKSALVAAWLGPDRAPVIDLARCDDWFAACSRIAGTLGIGLGRDPVDRLGNALAAAEVPLLVFDEGEALAEPLAAALDRWLELAPALAVVVTSRIRLGCAHEHRVELAPLSLEHGVALLVALAPDSPADGRAAALVREVGGLPLAIELCAGRLGTLGIDDVLRLLTSRPLDTLAGGEGRHGSARRAVAWSWDQLSDADRAALSSLSVCRGGFDLDAAQALVAEFAPDVLERLMRHHLVHRDGASRWSVSLPVRAFAESELVDRDAAWRRHAAHFAAWVDAAPDPARIRAEEANLVVTSERVPVVGELAPRCCAPVVAHYANAGPPERALSLIARVLPAAGGAGPQLLLHRAIAQAHLGQIAATTADARAVYDGPGSPAERARALNILVHVDAWGADRERALAEVDTFAAGLGSPEDDPLLQHVQARAALLVRIGRYEEAREQMVARVEWCRARGGADQVRAQLGVLGYVDKLPDFGPEFEKFAADLRKAAEAP